MGTPGPRQASMQVCFLEGLGLPPPLTHGHRTRHAPTPRSPRPALPREPRPGVVGLPVQAASYSRVGVPIRAPPAPHNCRGRDPQTDGGWHHTVVSAAATDGLGQSGKPPCSMASSRGSPSKWPDSWASSADPKPVSRVGLCTGTFNAVPVMLSGLGCGLLPPSPVTGQPRVEGHPVSAPASLPRLVPHSRRPLGPCPAAS